MDLSLPYHSARRPPPVGHHGAESRNTSLGSRSQTNNAISGDTSVHRPLGPETSYANYDSRITNQVGQQTIYGGQEINYYGSDASHRTPATADIAIITATATEYDAVASVLSMDFPCSIFADDHFTYLSSTILGQRLLVLLLEDKGSIHASQGGQILVQQYPTLKLLLLVGVCAGFGKDNNGTGIFLGDVIMSQSMINCNQNTRWNPIGVAMGNLTSSKPNHGKVRQTMKLMTTESMSMQFQRVLQQNLMRLENIQQPDSWTDRLFDPSYHHLHRNNDCLSAESKCDPSTSNICSEAVQKSCEDLGCDKTMLIERSRRSEVRVHIGPFASGPFVLRNPNIRDGLSRDYDVIAFDEEGAAIWDLNRPVVIIKGVSDYADSHKTKTWQRYAATTAACAMMAFIECYTGQANNKPSTTDRVSDGAESRTREKVTVRHDLCNPINYSMQSLRVPLEVHEEFSDWYRRKIKNLLLWGDDNSRWLFTAMTTLHDQLVKDERGVVFFDCTELCYSTDQSFAVKLIEAVYKCCVIPDLSIFSKPIELDLNVINWLDEELAEPVAVMIYDLRGEPERDLKIGSLAVRCIEALVKANHFDVLVTARYQVNIGDSSAHLMQEKNIGQLWRLQPLEL